MKNKIKHILSLLGLAVYVVLAIGSKNADEKQSNPPTGKNSGENEPKVAESSVDSRKLSEIESYLARGSWTCTKVEKGSAPFMKGATFIFSKGTLIVTGEGTTVENKYKITGIIDKFPEGSKFSAIIKINDNNDMLSWIGDDLMVLSWGGDVAKLRMQR